MDSLTRNFMDSLTRKETPDRGKINMHSAQEVKYWTHELTGKGGAAVEFETRRPAVCHGEIRMAKALLAAIGLGFALLIAAFVYAAFTL
jgi:Protein of unknown function (DUF3606)